MSINSIFVFDSINSKLRTFVSKSISTKQELPITKTRTMCIKPIFMCDEQDYNK